MIDITKNISRDKLAHFFASFIVLSASQLFLIDLHSYLLLLFLVILKDGLNDLILKKGKFEWMDILFGSLPIVLDLINKYI